MSAIAEIVTDAELNAQRSALLDAIGMDWNELRDRGEDFTLSDEQRDVYEAIVGIDWLLTGQ